MIYNCYQVRRVLVKSFYSSLCKFVIKIHSVNLSLKAPKNNYINRVVNNGFQSLHFFNINYVIAN